ncbi:Mitogen-activated protein kinase kinase kinase 12, partial [Stegodyphus mimosarum]
MHLDIAAVEILSTPDEEYFQTQATWKKEIGSYMEKMNDDSSCGLHVEEDLIKRRKEELKRAQDIREHYEKKLERANNLYMELANCRLQVEQKEQELKEREQSIKYGSSYTRHSKKNIRRFLKHERSAKKRSQKMESTSKNSNVQYSAFHGSAKSRIRRAKCNYSNSPGMEKFDYSVPFNIAESPYGAQYELPFLIDSETQTDILETNENVDKPCAKNFINLVQNISVNDSISTHENLDMFAQNSLQCDLHNKLLSQTPSSVKWQVIKAENSSFDHEKSTGDNLLCDINSVNCHSAVYNLSPVHIKNNCVQNVSIVGTRSLKKRRKFHQFCRMGSFRGKFLLKKFGSVQEISTT